ncbi:MAG TPA: response regulator [Microvirga sp.]|jgi:DNA-binding response OmpR family regulator|nr:response regulator [Microvirga sp.]
MSKHAGGRPLVLVLEDEVIVALNLQDEFEEAGYSVAGPFTTCADARSWLASNEPDAAVLDTVLKDGSCREIALELARREIPFLIYSGHAEDRELLGEFHHVTWIEKPVPPFVLVDGCRQLLPKAA